MTYFYHDYPAIGAFDDFLLPDSETLREVFMDEQEEFEELQEEPYVKGMDEAQQWEMEAAETHHPFH